MKFRGLFLKDYINIGVYSRDKNQEFHDPETLIECSDRTKQLIDNQKT